MIIYSRPLIIMISFFLNIAISWSMECSSIYPKKEKKYSMFISPKKFAAEQEHLIFSAQEVPKELMKSPQVQNYIEKLNFQGDASMYILPGAGQSIWSTSEITGWYLASNQLADPSYDAVETIMAMARNKTPEGWEWVSREALDHLQRAFQAYVVGFDAGKEKENELHRYITMLRGNSDDIERLESELYPGIPKKDRPPLEAPLDSTGEPVPITSLAYHDLVFRMTTYELEIRKIKRKAEQEELSKGPKLDIQFELDVQKFFGHNGQNDFSKENFITVSPETAKNFLSSLVRESLVRRQIIFERTFSETDPYGESDSKKLEDTIFSVSLNPQLRPYFQELLDLDFRDGERPLAVDNFWFGFPALDLGMGIGAIVDLGVSNTESLSTELRISIKNPENFDYNLLGESDQIKIRGYLKQFINSLPSDLRTGLKYEVDEEQRYFSLWSTTSPEAILDLYFQLLSELPRSSEAIVF